jgi:hypothetical protein
MQESEKEHSVTHDTDKDDSARDEKRRTSDMTSMKSVGSTTIKLERTSPAVEGCINKTN